jgi:hypothetical protein
MHIRPEKGTVQYYVCVEQAHDSHTAARAEVHDVWDDDDMQHNIGHTLGDALGRLWGDKFLALGTLADAATMIDDIDEEELEIKGCLEQETAALIKMLEGAREYSKLRRAFFSGEAFNAN